ncbi:uncharacterized protein Dwil_GK23877 [Drosophila willistoni]|uniref:Uncharacterized protein n=1 Tax=Drosophila willistoni TaxID=7260 RepID=B4MTN6_DROWI|nr:uncharacterized protein LOC6641675 [Drosophila willistoni]EDW75475.1 uncharacterized protein Dwil_GK23877 [Drosophila willistoni]
MSQDNDEIEVDISYRETRETKSEGDVEEADEQNLQPCGSQTLDKRLNPNAPAFVPGLTASILANKIIEELPPYCIWSRASTPENDSFGVPYDRIWRESPFNHRSPVTRSVTLNARAKPYVPKSLQFQEVVDDVVQQQPQRQLHPELSERVEEFSRTSLRNEQVENDFDEPYRCCGCRMM